MPEPACGLTSGEQARTDEGKLESQAWTPAGPVNAVRLALRLQTHGEPDARAFRRLLQAAMVLKAKDYAPKGRGTAGRCRVRQIGQRRDGNFCPRRPATGFDLALCFIVADATMATSCARDLLAPAPPHPRSNPGPRLIRCKSPPFFACFSTV
jgi:hypothetical protein